MAIVQTADSLDRAFRRYFGVAPFGFQMRAASHLLDDQNVVLQAPTGAGKTRAALFPWLYAREHGLSFADRLIYALPLRTLTSSLFLDTQASLAKLFPQVRVTIQMGSDARDSFFEGHVIFTTIDQILSAYIGVPVSLSPRMANLPAGALIGSYVVFDEFHLLEPGRALGTALDLAERFFPYARVLLMTATFPENAREEVQRRSYATSVEVDTRELASIPSQRDKKRVFEWHDRPMQASDILTAHQDKSIVVVNQVERAQALYREVKTLLRSAPPGEKPELILLHSRFLPADRDKHEGSIRERFQRGGSGNAILIATQVVEVGLDISADVMHSEIAPAASLFQRAGRCARFAGEDGIVHVYALPTNAQGRPRYGPYLHEQERLVDATAREIVGASGRPIGYDLERQIVDRVHGQTDEQALAGANQLDRRQRVEETIILGPPGAVRELIRQVDAVNVLVHDHPATLRMDRRPQMFSLDRSVLAGFLSDIDLTANPPPLLVPTFEDDESRWDSVVWTRPASREVAKAQFIVSLHPSVARYCPVVGLELNQRGSFRSAETTDAHDVAFTPYSYQREPYTDHVHNAVAAASARQAEYAVGRRRLAAQLGSTENHIAELVLLAVALHDVGKLSRRWQESIWRWQCDAFNTPRDGFLAHSDFDGTVAWQRAKSKNHLYRKPPHAAEGAYASLPMLKEAVVHAGLGQRETSDLYWALVSAIARHHGARTRELAEFDLSAGAREEARRSIASFTASFKVQVRLIESPTLAVREMFKDKLTTPERSLAYPFYLFVARQLRLADQESLSGG